MCDIFSLGVILFGMLTSRLPFVTIMKKKGLLGEYKKSSKYTLFCDNNEQFWYQCVQHARNVKPQAKHLIRLMLEYNPSQRISIAQILDNEWFKGKKLSSDLDDECIDVSLREKIEVLLNKIATESPKDKTCNNSKNNSTDKVKQKSEIQNPKSQISMVPIWIDEDCSGKEYLYTTAQWKCVYDAFTNYIKTMTAKGTAIYHKQSKTLACSCLIANYETKFDITMYESRKYNQLEKKNVMNKKINTNKTYLVFIDPITVNGEHFELFKHNMLSDEQIAPVITGIIDTVDNGILDPAKNGIPMGVVAENNNKTPITNDNVCPICQNDFCITV